MKDEHAKNEDYLTYYQRAYGDFLVESRLVDGEDPIGMFLAGQPEGFFPDEPMNTYNLQLNMGCEVFARLDLGAGSHEAKMLRGGFVISPPDVRSEYSVYNQHQLMCLGVPRKFFDNAATELNIDTDIVETLLTGAHMDIVVRQLMKECWIESNSSSRRGALFIDSNLMTLASRLLSLAIGKKSLKQESNQSGLSDNNYDRICQYVDSNIDTNLRMKSLANLVGMSEYGFARMFKIRTNQSPYQWVIERRLGRAEQLLRTTKMELAQIAFAVGFSSQSHMTTLFSQRSGITPAEFRKRL